MPALPVLWRDMKDVFWIRCAAIFGFLAVALGAFGAHMLKPTLTANDTEAIWNTAVQYHFFHTVPLLFLGLCPRSMRVSGFCFALGIVIFSGSLYLLALTGIRWLGAITPIGGLLFLAGWLWLGFKASAVVSSAAHPSNSSTTNP